MGKDSCPLMSGLGIGAANSTDAAIVCYEWCPLWDEKTQKGRCLYEIPVQYWFKYRPLLEDAIPVVKKKYAEYIERENIDESKRRRGNCTLS